MTIAAVASRLQIFGNPIVYTDEEYYLLVGERILHGAVPYIDLWDRKPAGLFLLFAAIRELGGDGVLAYQIVGTLFAIATSLLIVRIALEFSNRWGAIAAGVAYITWLDLGTAGGGQSPLFYNLPVCAAGLITLRAVQGSTKPFPNLTGAGASAMLLMGLAMQIKYSAIFEGIFFGIVFLVLTWEKFGIAGFLSNAFLLIVIALLPTLAILAAYATAGHGEAFIYANFISVFQRGNPSGLKLLRNLGATGLVLVPLILCGIGRPVRADVPAQAARRFVLLWLAASVGGFLVFGTYLQHYLLPVLVPAAAAAAVLFGRGPSRLPALLPIAVAFIAGQLLLAHDARHRGTARQFTAITHFIDPDGCLFVYSGEPAFYRATKACIPTRFAFPSQLSRLGEATGIGTNPVTEITRIMRTHPATVIVSQPYSDEDMAARQVTLDALNKNYVRVLHTRLGSNGVDLFRLRPDEP
ncbi:MAG: hypothetical protein ACRYGI_10165 [Janthinobacterium lividum]